MIVGIYLAAGSSSRMGCKKLSLPFHGSSLGSIALKTALLSDLDHLIVVTRRLDSLEWIEGSLFNTPFKSRWQLAECPEAEQGMSYSLRTGLEAAQMHSAEAVVVLLADQPFITSEIVNQLIHHYKHEHAGYIASSCNGQISPPVLFDAEFFAEFSQLRGDEGAKRIIKEHPQQGSILEFRSAKSFVDLDTMEQYLSEVESASDL